jgi:hypothetical protein
VLIRLSSKLQATFSIALEYSQLVGPCSGVACAVPVHESGPVPCQIDLFVTVDGAPAGVEAVACRGYPSPA